MASLDSDDPLGGPGQIVEIDETGIGGTAKGSFGRLAGNKPIVLGMLEKGGELITRVVPSIRRNVLVPVVQEHVLPGTHIHTDGLASYRLLKNYGFRHDSVAHQTGQYVSETGCTVNRIEGFWAMLKRGINGTHIHVSAKHLPKYLGEFEYRWNMRHCGHLMLDRLLYSFAR